MGLTIGVDVGGTKIAAGVVDPEGRVLDRVRVPTPTGSSDETADAVARAVEGLRRGRDVSAVGVGAAGFVDRDRAVVSFAPNLPWRDEPLQQDVAARVGLPVVIENDANATAWAEYRFGAGRGCDDLCVVALGTGIGGGIVLGGRLVRGAFGVAGEFGHVRVVPDGRLCGCGNRGCWEQYASGRALVREARDRAALHPATATRLLRLVDGDVHRISGEAVSRAAADGDPAAGAAFAEVGRWLGQGLADIAAVLDPARFVVGGGVARAGELLMEPARRAFQAALTGRGHRPVAAIVTAELGDAAGLIGAADLARVA